jgi:hypothetical protein
MTAHDNEGKARIISVCPVDMPLAPRYTHEMTYRAMQQYAFVAWDISCSISITRPSSIGRPRFAPVSQWLHVVRTRCTASVRVCDWIQAEDNNFYVLADVCGLTVHI